MVLEQRRERGSQTPLGRGRTRTVIFVVDGVRQLGQDLGYIEKRQQVYQCFYSSMLSRLRLVVRIGRMWRAF